MDSAEAIVQFWTSAVGTNAGGLRAGGTRAGGMSVGGTSAGGTSAGGTSVKGVVGTLESIVQFSTSAGGTNTVA